MEFVEKLTRDEMKKVMAGSGGSCQVYVVTDSGNSYWSECVSYQEALDGWNDGYDGASAGGYCCASCGSGNFSNANQGCMTQE